MSIENQVREAVVNNRSGEIVISQNNASLSSQEFIKLLQELRAPGTLKINRYRCSISPATVKEWEWLERASQHNSFTVRVNTQTASQAIEWFGGVFSDGLSAKDLRDLKQVNREWNQTESERQAAGYGKTRMGGCR